MPIPPAASRSTTRSATRARPAGGRSAARARRRRCGPAVRPLPGRPSMRRTSMAAPSATATSPVATTGRAAWSASTWSRVEGAGPARACSAPRDKKKRPVPEDGALSIPRLGAAHVDRAGALRICFDLELDALAADEAVEVDRGVEAAAMEEVFLLVLRSDEAEAAIGYDLLDGSGGHIDLHVFSNTICHCTVRSRRRVDHAKHRHELRRTASIARPFASAPGSGPQSTPSNGSVSGGSDGS